MTDFEIIQALIARDNKVTQDFFFTQCRPLFNSIIGRVFDYEVDYDECINELYLHLLYNNGERLKQFQGLKQHPDLIPYSALPDGEKEYDRLMAVNTIKLVKKLGWKIVK